ncbi:MAG: N-acetyltransferase family protein [Limnohabitans sp.]
MSPLANPTPGFWRQLWRRWCAAADPGSSGGAPRARGWVPIRVLSPRHKPRILGHLLALSEGDRYLRFGYPATDQHIRRYVDGLDFRRDEIFGIFNRRLQLVAMAHLAFSVDPQWASCAEFGVSVAASQRGRGMGARLFGRAVNFARNQGVHMFFIHALSENAAMLRIARQAGARIERDGSESEAYLSLPEATLDSQVSGLLQDHMAELDYQFKLQARQFRDWLATLQEVRRSAREARQPHDPPA